MKLRPPLLWPDPVCGPQLNAEAQGPQLGAPQGRLRPGANPALSRGQKPQARRGAQVCTATTSLGPGTPTGRGQQASQQRGKRSKPVGSSGVPGAGAPPAGRAPRAEEPHRDAEGWAPLTGAAPATLTRGPGQSGSHIISIRRAAGQVQN